MNAKFSEIGLPNSRFTVFAFVIKRVQGCSQSDALKWVTCALFIFSLTARSAKCAQQKSIMHCVWSCGMQIRYAKRTPMQLQLPGVQRTPAPTQRLHAVNLTCSTASACYLFTFFNLFVGLFGIITFDPFYKTNNTLISSCISGVATWFRTFTMLCKPNSPAPPPPPPGSFGSHHCKCPQCMLHCR